MCICIFPILFFVACEGQKQQPVSEHWNGRFFVNPGLAEDALPKFRDAFKMEQGKRAKWPDRVENTAVPDLPEQLEPDEIALTFVNHATFLIQINGINVLTDPVWSRRIGPFNRIGPVRVRDPGIAFNDLPDIDLVLISHNHYDHLDLATLKRLNKKFKPLILVPIGDKILVKSVGCDRVMELDWWETVELNGDFRITFAPAQHQSNRGVFDRHKSLWGSFMITAGSRRIYYGGDSGYGPHYIQIKDRLGPPDLALLPIGAYEPRWFLKVIHMNPHEAVVAHRDLGAMKSVGMHYGTFQLSEEAIYQPIHDLKEAIAATGLVKNDSITLNEGETRRY